MDFHTCPLFQVLCSCRVCRFTYFVVNTKGQHTHYKKKQTKLNRRLQTRRQRNIAFNSLCDFEWVCISFVLLASTANLHVTRIALENSEAHIDKNITWTNIAFVIQYIWNFDKSVLNIDDAQIQIRLLVWPQKTTILIDIIFKWQIDHYECIMNIPVFRMEGNNEGFGN